MEWLREYLLRLICAAILCGLATAFLGKKGAVGVTVKLMAGIFIAFTLVSPWLELRIGDMSDYFEGISSDAGLVVINAEKDMKEELASIIKAKTEAYILDKADSFGAELTVEVSVDDSELPVPCAVRVSGSISPYGKVQLQKWISEDFGITLEDQTWIG